MVKRNFEVVFNNGMLRQILVLPEAPIKMFFIFEGKELHLRVKKGKKDLYAISYQRGFPETYSNNWPEQTASKRSLDNLKFSNDFKQSSEIPTKRPKLRTQVLRFSDSTQNLNDKQVTENSNDDTIDTGPPPESSLSSQKHKSSISQRTLIVKKAACKNSHEKIIENEVGDEQINAVSDRTSVIQENVQVAHKSRVITEESHQDIKFVSSSNAENEDQVEGINFSDEYDSMAVDIETSFSDDSTDKDDDTNMPQKKKICPTRKDVNVPVGMLIQQNKSEKQSRISQSLESYNQAKGRNAIASDLRLGLLSESVDDPDIVTHSQKGSLIVSVNRTDCSQDCDSKDQEDESTRLQKKGRCKFCLKFVFRNDNRRRLFRFPRCSEISKMWANASGLKCIIEATAPERRHKFSICSDHFTINDYTNPTKRSRLKWSAVPTQHLPKSKIINPLLPQNTNILESMKSKLKLALKKPDSKSTFSQNPSPAKPKTALQTSFKTSPESKCKTTTSKEEGQKSLVNISPSDSSGSVIKTIALQSFSASSVHKKSHAPSNSVHCEQSPLASLSRVTVQKITLQDLLKATSSKLKTESKMPTESSSQSSLNISHSESVGTEVKHIITSIPPSVVQSENAVTEVTSQETLSTNE